MWLLLLVVVGGCGGRGSDAGVSPGTPVGASNYGGHVPVDMTLLPLALYLCAGLQKLTQDSRREHGEYRPQDPQSAFAWNCVAIVQGLRCSCIHCRTQQGRKMEHFPEVISRIIQSSRTLQATITPNKGLPDTRNNVQFPSANSAGRIRSPSATWKMSEIPQRPP